MEGLSNGGRQAKVFRNEAPIVVHGIGEQRKNETVLNVVNRFAEARRRPLGQKGQRNIITLGKANGQTGREQRSYTCRYDPPENNFTPWLEFEGIPQPALKRTNPSKYESLVELPFLGKPATSGENLRFVDLHWADVMQQNETAVLQKVDLWAQGLLGRLQLKHLFAKKRGNSGWDVPAWILHFLGTLVKFLVFLRRLMHFRFGEMEDMLFVKFLGDVQQYGEFPFCRGEAVRRFHKLMARIEEDHNSEMKKNGRDPKDEDNQPKYTIIAHSLGTVMSMDALLYAHARSDIRGSTHPNYITKLHPNLPLQGYIKEDEQHLPFLNTNWVKRVEHFVTLGSPIDKYLVMWWLNYKHFLKPEEWVDQDWLNQDTKKFERKHKIRHFNYCDQQDPVGHNLDVAASAPAFKEVFVTQHGDDRVYNRYSIPGAAHNAYWKDSHLFDWILHKTVDADKPGFDKNAVKPPNWFHPGKYLFLLVFTYVLVPLLTTGIIYLSLDWVLQKGTSLQSGLTAAIVFIAAVYLGWKLINFLIMGRQVQRAKANLSIAKPFEKFIRWMSSWIVRGVLIVVPLAFFYLATDSLTCVPYRLYCCCWELSFSWIGFFVFVYVAGYFFWAKSRLRIGHMKIEFDPYATEP